MIETGQQELLDLGVAIRFRRGREGAGAISTQRI
jgi:hypothetical protein